MALKTQVSADGTKIFVADYEYTTQSTKAIIRMVLTSNGAVTTLAGSAAAGAVWADGTGSNAGFVSVFGLALNAAGDTLFVTEENGTNEI